VRAQALAPLRGSAHQRARQATDANLTTVMSNSFGFGGTNGTLVFRKV
jgi:3-oxoacyl-(acyl-carrier-protein) synthase